MIPRYTRKEMGAVWEDRNRFNIMLEVEILSAEAWAREGVVPKNSIKTIRAKAKIDIPKILEIEKTVKHDIIAFLTQVADSIGPEGRFLHLGMTSSDVLDTSFALQVRDASDILLRELTELKDTVGRQALDYKDTLCIGRTHGIHAEPVTFGLKLLVWFEELKRDIERLKSARETMLVGKISGAVGTWAFLEPELEIEALGYLGLKAPSITNQVIQRDRYAEFIAALAIIAGTFDKIATEIRHLQRTEVGEAAEPFGRGQKGSSAMPHKKNPMTCERVSGLARVVRGNLIVALENMTLWHERDISHSSAERVIFPDSCIIIDYLCSKLQNIIGSLVANPDAMMRNLELTRGVVFSQRVLLELVKSGMKREDAYVIVQTAAHEALKEGGDFRESIRKNKDVLNRLGEKIEELFDYWYFVRYRGEAYRRAGLEG